MDKVTISGIKFDKEGRLNTFESMSTTYSMEEVVADLNNSQNMNDIQKLISKYKNLVAKDDRPHVLYQASKKDAYFDETLFIGVPLTTSTNSVSVKAEFSPYFLTIGPKSHAKVYESQLVKTPNLKPKMDEEGNNVKISHDQYIEIGNTIIKHFANIIKNNFEIMEEINMIENLESAVEELAKSNASLEKASHEAKDAYEVLLERFDALLEAVEEQGLNLSNSPALNT